MCLNDALSLRKSFHANARCHAGLHVPVGVPVKKQLRADKARQVPKPYTHA